MSAVVGLGRDGTLAHWVPLGDTLSVRDTLSGCVTLSGHDTFSGCVTQDPMVGHSPHSPCWRGCVHE